MPPHQPEWSFGPAITILPTDKRFNGMEEPEVCSRCGKPFTAIPLLLFSLDEDAYLYRFHFGCVGLGAENDKPMEGDGLSDE